MSRYVDEELLIEKMTRLRGCSCSYSDGIIDEVEDIMSDLPTADVIPIPDNATNGDVITNIFKCLPHIGFNEEYGNVWFYKNGEAVARFDLTWWNAPFKKEVE